MRKQRILRVLAICLVTLAAGVLGSGSAQAAGGTVVVALGAGGTHTCAITTEGGLQCWGTKNLAGGPSANGDVPAGVVGFESGVAAVDGGSDHTCVLTVTGGVRCFGFSIFLGDGIWNGSSGPVDVVGLESGVSAISATFWHTCALTSAGDVKCWGNNSFGQLGDGTTSHQNAPVDVAGLDGGVTAVAAGHGHTCALTTVGGVKCWGSNIVGQLGDGTLTESNVPVDVLDDEGNPLSGVVAIAAGQFHTCLLTTAGGVKCWGLNYSGQLGDGTSGENNVSSTPVDVLGLESGVEAIAPGGIHTCALATSGGVKCWGWNKHGQLGAATTELCPSFGVDSSTDPCSTTPVDVTGMTDGVEAVAAGDSHTCALTTAGRVRCWGNNSVGQLGNGTMTDSPVPVAVLFDADDDGCTDEQELGTIPALGGLRNPKSFWDFFDTPTGTPPERDRRVNIVDIGAIVLHFGTSGDPGIDPLSAPPASGYHTAFDRSQAAEGGDPWDLGPPDGSINIIDIAAVVIQFGHTCTNIPV